MPNFGVPMLQNAKGPNLNSAIQKKKVSFFSLEQDHDVDIYLDFKKCHFHHS